MIKELLTLYIDNTPVQYYIRFTRERTLFNFQPTLKNKTAPSFTIFFQDHDWITEDQVEGSILEQARQKIKAINSDNIFDIL